MLGVTTTVGTAYTRLTAATPVTEEEFPTEGAVVAVTTWVTLMAVGPRARDEDLPSVPLVAMHLRRAAGEDMEAEVLEEEATQQEAMGATVAEEVRGVVEEATREVRP